MREIPRLVIALLAGAITVAAFAPTEWWWLPWPCLTVLFVMHSGLSPTAALRLGFAWGLGLYLAGVSWVYVSLHVYGGMPLWMGSIAVLLFAAVVALFIAVPCWLSALTAGESSAPAYQLKRLTLLVAFWIMFEWAKSWVLTGFPWLDLGYTQTGSWLFALAPLGGVYLISFVIVASSAALAYGWLSNDRRKSALKILPVLSLLGLSLVPLATVQWSKPLGEARHIGIVQPNTPINTKWQAQHRDQTIRKLATLSQELVSDAQSPAELVVWPETGLALFYQQTDEQFWQSIVPQGGSLLTGLVDGPRAGESYNAAILICDGQQTLYRKRHLVPFGEYLPLRFLFGWVLDYLQLPMSDFSSWQGPQPLTCGDNLTIGLSICYEDAFAGEHRRFNSAATVLVNISEDAWFGDSLAPHQRLQMAQMRARELSRPMLRSANSGPSAVIDERGKVLKKSEQFQIATISHAVQPQTGSTPFGRFGNWIVWLAVGLAFVLPAFTRRRRVLAN